MHASEFLIRLGLGCLAGVLSAFLWCLFKTIVPLACYKDYAELRSMPGKLAYQVMLRAYSRGPRVLGLVLPKAVLFCSMAVGAALMVEFYSSSPIVRFIWVFGFCLLGWFIARIIEITYFRRHVAAEARHHGLGLT